MRRISTPIFTVLLGLTPIFAAATVTGCASTKSATAADTSQTPGPSCNVQINPTIKHVVSTYTGFKVTEAIHFADNKAEILPDSESLLQEVATVIKENPDLLNIYIAGYASSEGSADLNAKLSGARAYSVKAWLIANGIDFNRISAGGYGTASPVGDNATEAGREANRRVEFIAIKYVYDGKSYENKIPPGALVQQ